MIREKRGRIPAVVLRIADVYDEEGHSIPTADIQNLMFTALVLVNFAVVPNERVPSSARRAASA